MRRIILWAIVPLLTCQLHAQTSTGGAFAKRLTMGTSVTYLPQAKREITQNVYHETTWDKNIAVSVTESIHVGLSHKWVYTQGSSFIDNKEDSQTYNLFGAFVQYDFLPKSRKRLLAEVSYHVGDYCTCGQLDPFRRQQLSYIGFGGGYDLPLWRGFSLDMAIVAHYILNDVPLKYSFTQYVVGINYTIGWQR